MKTRCRFLAFSLSWLMFGCGSAPPPQTLAESPKLTSAPTPEPPSSGAAVTTASAATSAPAPSAAADDAPPAEEQDRFAKVPGLIKLYQTEGPMDLDERCGEYEVRTRLSKDQTRVEIVNAAGKIVRQFKPAPGLERYEPAWCFDVTGDGVPELALTRTTGGAHCCHENTLISLTPQLETLVVHAQGNGSMDLLTPVDVDGDGTWELMDTNDVLVGEGSEPYAFTHFFPAIFRLQKGKYVRATKLFPDYLKAERERAMKDLSACAPGCWNGGDGEYVLGLSLLLGDWDSFKQTAGCPEPAQKQLEKLGKRISKSLR
ncbi:MAG: hypothetical protein R3B07_02465 [Polyangiaceae bacterium]